jgi:hypothetical protein
LVNQGSDDDYEVHEPENLNTTTAQEGATGYLHPLYCQSLSEFGRPRLLRESGAWILERRIPNSRLLDAMGCYPLFACSDWSRLSIDLEEIGNSLVSLSLVTDPFGEYDPAGLRHCFPDLVVPFKEHFVVDLSRAPETFVHSHHQRNARKALREIRVEECDNPQDVLEEWTTLYATLVERHTITGIAAFSKESFARQLRVPGMVVLRAMHNNTTVGMLLWYGQGNRAYYHLGAYSTRGYDLGASFALFDYAITYFAQRGFAWLNLGSGAGVGTSVEQGLSRFKQGWSTGVRTAYFCGRILDPEKYQEILETRGLPPTRYFPAYRAGEFS